MDNKSVEPTNTEQQACFGSESGLAKATERETHAAGRSVATGTESVATSEDHFSQPNSTIWTIFSLPGFVVF